MSDVPPSSLAAFVFVQPRPRRPASFIVNSYHPRLCGTLHTDGRTDGRTERGWWSEERRQKEIRLIISPRAAAGEGERERERERGRGRESLPSTATHDRISARKKEERDSGGDGVEELN